MNRLHKYGVLLTHCFLLVASDLGDFREEELIPLGRYDRVKRQATGPEGPVNTGPGASPPSPGEPDARGAGAPSPPEALGRPSGSPPKNGGSPGSPVIVPNGSTPSPLGDDNLGSGDEDPVFIPNVNAPVGPPSPGQSTPDSPESSTPGTPGTPSTGVPGGPCQEYEFQCSNLMCIPRGWRCDSEEDCGDNSDEDNCPDEPGRSPTPVEPSPTPPRSDPSPSPFPNPSVPLDEENVFQEICAGEFFQSTCDRGSVVRIRSAQYGRMQLGRCLTTDLGNIGFSNDVTSVLQARCDGQELCQMSVPHEDLEAISVPDDLRSYLTVDYTCVPTDCQTGVVCSTDTDNRCVPEAQVCDGNPDCPLGEDELGCQRIGTLLNDGWTFNGIRTSTEGSSGRVELLFTNDNGTSSWGSICASGWDDLAAQVTCRMFGLQYGRTIEPNPDDAPPANSLVWLSYVNCTGDESNIFSCAHDQISYQSCDSSSLATISCSNEPVQETSEISQTSNASEVISTETCQTEALELSCAAGTVIEMVEAQYGRMALGRCVTSDTGTIGCYSFVTDILETLCNGKESCDVDITNTELVQMTPCLADVASYLKTQHRCIEASTCQPGNFRCRNGNCVIDSWTCDGFDDCGDGSDEADCPCPEFRCNNSKCISNDWVCDGTDDCGDVSDETSCPARTCGTTEFLCGNGLTCVSRAWRCDGDNDCGDMSDEEACDEPIVCDPSEFKCLNNEKCIEMESVCNGAADCSDGSDEADCPSTTTTSTTTVAMSTQTTDETTAATPLCADEQIQCNTTSSTDTICLNATSRCDGINDCGDWEDEFDCNRTVGQVCNGTDFLCNNNVCMPGDWVCDGADDCGDNSDEVPEYCRLIPCEDGETKCNTSGECLPSDWFCDGGQDCSDGSDEMNCTDPCPNQVLCNGTGRCISPYYVCDGDNDCGDREDERNCSVSCDPSEFPCLNNEECIGMESVCNGANDCSDGSDEFNCSTSNPTVNTTTMSTPTATNESMGACDSGFKECLGGECIPELLWCNGVPNCPFGDDEFNCTSIPVKKHVYQEECGWCYNGGTCYAESAFSSGSCQCAVGYFGSKCHVPVPKCEADDDCMNGGNCLKLLIGQPGVCENCNPGFTGPLCDSTISDSSEDGCGGCLNGGDCQQSGPTEKSCLCSGHWTGQSCEYTMPGCTDDDDCNGGVCEKEAESDWRRCTACPQNVTGPNCELPLIPEIDPCPGLVYCNGSSNCIDPNWLCDGDNDCGDEEDEMNCTERKCPPNRIACNSTSQCIFPGWRCDGRDDCGDNEDETNCHLVPCPDASRPVRCNSTQDCIPRGWVCDGDNDCGDFEDEQNCTNTNVGGCSPGLMPCSDGSCIPFTAVCNGSAECPRGEDEFNCTGIVNNGTISCSMLQFPCMDAAGCVNSSQVCDGTPDCTDGSDEAPMVCQNACNPEVEFSCRLGVCIPQSLQCNGLRECPLGDDEMNCNRTLNSTCLPDEFRCMTFGECINQTRVCDGSHDCLDSSDEINCQGPSMPGIEELMSQIVEMLDINQLMSQIANMSGLIEQSVASLQNEVQKTTENVTRELLETKMMVTSQQEEITQLKQTALFVSNHANNLRDDLNENVERVDDLHEDKNDLQIVVGERLDAQKSRIDAVQNYSQELNSELQALKIVADSQTAEIQELKRLSTEKDEQIKNMMELMNNFTMQMQANAAETDIRLMTLAAAQNSTELRINSMAENSTEEDTALKLEMLELSEKIGQNKADMEEAMELQNDSIQLRLKDQAEKHQLLQSDLEMTKENNTENAMFVNASRMELLMDVATLRTRVENKESIIESLRNTTQQQIRQTETQESAMRSLRNETEHQKQLTEMQKLAIANLQNETRQLKERIDIQDSAMSILRDENDNQRQQLDMQVLLLEELHNTTEQQTRQIERQQLVMAVLRNETQQQQQQQQEEEAPPLEERVDSNALQSMPPSGPTLEDLETLATRLSTQEGMVSSLNSSVQIQLNLLRERLNSQILNLNRTLRADLVNVVASIPQANGQTEQPGEVSASSSALSGCYYTNFERNSPVTPFTAPTTTTPWTPTAINNKMLYMVIGAQCSTETGTSAVLESRLHPDRQYLGVYQFRCLCRGLQRGAQSRICTMHVWECPRPGA